MTNTNVDSPMTERVHGLTSSLLRTTRERLWSTSAAWAKGLMLRSGFMADVSNRRVRAGARYHLALPSTAGAEDSRLRDSCVVAPSYRYQLDAQVPAEYAARVRHENAVEPEAPLIWAEAPGTQLACGYRVPAEWRELRELRPGQSVAHLSRPAASALASVGAIVDGSDDASSRDLWRCGPNADLARALTATNFAVLSRVLSPGLTNAISQHYRALRESTRLEVDAFSGRLVEKDEAFAQHLLHQLQGFVTRLAGRPVVPTYCYSMWYLRGARLGIHTDNEQCEYSLSLSIDQSPRDAEPWPFCVVSRGGLRITELRVAPGDGVLFRGRTLPHYRRRLLSGEGATGILLHYNAAGPWREAGRSWR